MTRLTLVLTPAVMLAACFTPVDPCRSLCGDAGAAVGGGSGGGGGASGGGSGGGGPLTGAASISIEGIAWPASASLEGPNGFTRMLTASVVVPALEPGNYTLRAANVLEPDAVAARVFVSDQAAQSLTVVAGETASASVKYAADPETGFAYLITHAEPLPSVGPLRAFVRVFRATDLKTGGVKTALNVAQIPECRGGMAFLDRQDRIWIGCSTRQSAIDFRRFTRAQLLTESNPIPEARLSVAQTQRFLMDGAGHLWSWDVNTTFVGRHPDSDFDVVGNGVLPTPMSGFTRASPHLPRFFLSDGSLLAWDVASQSLGRYAAADLIGATGPVTVSHATSPNQYLGDGRFTKTDAAGLYLRNVQNIYELPSDPFAGDAGTFTPVKEFKVPDMHVMTPLLDASKRYWGYEIQRKVYVVLTPEQLAGSGGTELAGAWEISWPLMDPLEQYGVLLFYPPSHGQRYVGY